jgi:hypothetical protein
VSIERVIRFVAHQPAVRATSNASAAMRPTAHRASTTGWNDNGETKQADRQIDPQQFANREAKAQ